MAVPNLKRIRITPLERITAEGAVTNFAQKGNIVYTTAAKDGFYVLDVTDPENPAQVSPSPIDQFRLRLPNGETTSLPIRKFECRDILILGDILFIVGRDINFDVANDAGVICAFDISTPADPQWICSYQPDDSWDFLISGKHNNNWYQNMATDGTYIYIASQTFGLSVINPALGTGASTAISAVVGAGPTTITSNSHLHSELDIVKIVGTGVAALDDKYHQVTSVLTNTFVIDADGTGYVSGGSVSKGLALHSTYDPYDLFADFPLDAPDPDVFPYTTLELFWECSGIAISDSNDWVFLANHGNGIMAIDVSTPATPANPVWIDADLVGPVSTQSPTYPEPVYLRNRAVIIDGNYLYSCSNTNDDNPVTGAHPERGLQWLKIDDPTTLSESDWKWLPIAFEDNDNPWLTVQGFGVGDKPLQGITKEGNFVYIANGQRDLRQIHRHRSAGAYVGDFSHFDILSRHCARLLLRGSLCSSILHEVSVKANPGYAWLGSSNHPT